MKIIDVMLQELEHEAQTTRRVLERVPEEHLDWRPHPRSWSLGQLALHVATVPGSVATIAAEDRTEIPRFQQERCKSAADLLPALDQSLATAHQKLAHLDDGAMMATWRAMDGEREVLALPRVGLVRAIMLNHWYHHRGQLTVYLRQLDVPVPSIYGPSADENVFASKEAAAV